MLFYISIFLTIIFLSFITADKRTSKTQKDYTITLFIIVLSIIAGTRLVGYDFNSYQEIFQSTPALFEYRRENPSIELGFELIISTVKLFSDNYHLFLFIFAFITYITAGILFYKYSPYPVISFGMFICYAFCQQTMGQIRQPFAVLLAYLLLLPLYLERKYIWASIVILLSTILLHKSLFFCFLFFFFYNKVLKPKHILFYYSIALACFFLSNHAFNIILSLVPSNFYLYNVLNDYMTSKLLQFTFSLGMIERLFLFVTVYYIAYKYKFYHNNNLLRLMINLYFMGICIYFAFIKIAAEFATRGTFFYLYSIFIIIPILIKEAPIKIKYFLLTIALLWSAYVSTSVIRDGKDDYIPYNSILF
ncbi:EpsG family protein [Phocaeicola plebeius]|uniref:EpsG family protein n=1 Tax=Phocaeicola plebeius TaxID=310297 RepID=UPI0026EA6408|nr:EpsG family protein [Phocaeicola plebeius]